MRRAGECREDAAEEIVAHRVAVKVALDGQPVAERQDDGDDIVDGQAFNPRTSREGLLNAVANRRSQRAAVTNELGAHGVITDGAPPEVREDQLPLALIDECLGKETSDVTQRLPPRRGSGFQGDGSPDGLDTG